MPDQYFPAPAPTRTEFNTLNSTVTTLNSKIANSEFFGHATNISTDLNNETTVGIVQYNATTANIPTSSSNTPYGVCLTVGTNKTDASNSWYFQIAMCTGDKNLYVRSKINTAGWKTWSTITAS